MNTAINDRPHLVIEHTQSLYRANTMPFTNKLKRTVMSLGDLTQPHENGVFFGLS
jgi:hypothetical protein